MVRRARPQLSPWHVERDQGISSIFYGLVGSLNILHDFYRKGVQVARSCPLFRVYEVTDGPNLVRNLVYCVNRTCISMSAGRNSFPEDTQTG